MPRPAPPHAATTARSGRRGLSGPGAGGGAHARALVEATGLSCFRGDRLLFRDLNLALAPGQALHLRGPNGSGKTSLLRILCGLTRPESGEIRWLGDAHPPRGDVLVGYVGHSDGIKLELTPRENLRVAQALAANGGAGDIDAALATFDLAGFADVPCRTLSAGQRRRAALARLLLTDARIWVLDEPFTALDARATATLYGLVQRHLDEGGGVLITSHHALELEPGTSRVQDLSA